jgi:fatty acid desaturase
MTNEDYQALMEKNKNKESDDLVASFIVFSLFFSTLFFLTLSSFGHGFIWLIAQAFLGINILQWFFLLHDIGHDKFFSNKKFNLFFGHLASCFVILPFYPWRYIHRTHHQWVGYKDKDPTQNLLTLKDIPLKRSKIINFCWKYWIPIFTLSFSFDNFWNLKKLNNLYPEKKHKNLFSVILPALFHLYFLISMGPFQYLKVWGIAYLFFLVLCDPLLLSQHSAKKQMIANKNKVSMIHFREQDEYTRSLIFPNFVEKFILLGFNKHTLHHLIPTIPGYQLLEIDYNDYNSENWLTWLKEAKSIDGVELLYSEELNIKEILPINE